MTPVLYMQGPHNPQQQAQAVRQSMDRLQGEQRVLGKALGGAEVRRMLLYSLVYCHVPWCAITRCMVDVPLATRISTRCMLYMTLLKSHMRVYRALRERRQRSLQRSTSGRSTSWSSRSSSMQILCLHTVLRRSAWLKGSLEVGGRPCT